MGVFDKVEKDAEEAMAQDDPGLAQQAGQFGGGQAGQDMQAARNLIGKQRGADQDQDRTKAATRTAATRTTATRTGSQPGKRAPGSARCRAFALLTPCACAIFCACLSR